MSLKVGKIYRDTEGREVGIVAEIKGDVWASVRCAIQGTVVDTQYVGVLISSSVEGMDTARFNSDGLACGARVADLDLSTEEPNDPLNDKIVYIDGKRYRLHFEPEPEWITKTVGEP